MRLFRRCISCKLTRLMDGDGPALCDECKPKFSVCPQCSTPTANPMDRAEGYCGVCHDWTMPKTEPGAGEGAPGSEARA